MELPGVVKSVCSAVELRRDITAFDSLPYRAQEIVTGEVGPARKLLADEYLFRKTITSDQLGEDGTLTDEHDPYWRTRSRYFGIYDKTDPTQLYAAARLIFPEEGKGAASLQMHLDDLEPKWRERLAGIESSKLAEVASLVKEPGVSSAAVVELFRAMLHTSFEAEIGHLMWGLQPKLYRSLKLQFGPAMQRMGPRGARIRLGDLKTPFVPCLLDVGRAQELITRPRVIDRLLGRSALFGFMAKPWPEKPPQSQ